MLLGTTLGRAISRKPKFFPFRKRQLFNPFVPGAKPNSPFGFLHNVKPLQSQMVEECDEKYPALREDIRRFEKERGVFAYLLDTLIDFDTLRNRNPQTRTSGTSGATIIASPNGHDRREEKDLDNSKMHA
jgi:hypothetical protein